MKSIRTFILMAIGMIAFTATANTTAKLEQKQKVESVNGFQVHQDYSQVVNVFKEIQISQENFVLSVKVMNLKRIVNETNSYTVSLDVGWRSLQTLNHNIQKDQIVKQKKQIYQTTRNVLIS